MVAHRREEKTVSVEIEHAASGTLLKHSIADRWHKYYEGITEAIASF